MRRVVWLTLAVAINAIIVAVSQAQVDSYISSTDGFWDEARLWSLAEPPSISQSGISIAEDASVTVTIDSITASSFVSTLTISNLSVFSPSRNFINTLYLDNTGTIALHILNGLSVGMDPAGGGSSLISSNSTLIVDGSLGGQLQVNGTMEVIGGTVTLGTGLAITTSPETHGSLSITDGALFVVTNGPTVIGADNEETGEITVSDATLLTSSIIVAGCCQTDGDLVLNDGTLTVSGEMVVAGPDSGGAVFLNGGALTVTNATTTLGLEGVGFIVVSDGLFLARDIVAGVGPGESMLVINGGTSIISSNLQLGGNAVTATLSITGGQLFVGNLQIDGQGSEATVSITGGQLLVTNGLINVSGTFALFVDFNTFTFTTNFAAQCNVSGGQLAAKKIELGRFSTDGGGLTVDGGSVAVSDGMTLGDCTSNIVGDVWVNGGQLIVTNACGTGFIDIQNGQLILSNGVLQVDKLVMTNSCSSFVHAGGTVIVGSVILDPNAFQITSVAREGNDLRVTWLMAPGQTNALQAALGGAQGCYTTNDFTDIFVVTNNTTAGSLTNYLDVGAATNVPSRFYRARLAP